MPPIAPNPVEYAKSDVNVGRNIPGWIPVAMNLPMFAIVLMLGLQRPGFWVRTRWISEAKVWYAVLVVSGLSIGLAILRAYLSRRYHQKRRGGWLASAIVVALLSLLSARTIYPPGIHKHYNYASCESNIRMISLSIWMYTSHYGGQYPQTLQSLMLDADDPEAASSLTCPLSGDEMILGHDRESTTAALAQPGHVSYLYFGRGLNSATVAPKTLIACDKPHNHDRDDCDLWAVFADMTIQALPRAQLERMIAARMAATAPSIRSPKRRTATTHHSN